ncbi:EF-hand calcium-binding domain-containing protein 12-like [Colius striatus]|uniref:EF-hand calcium-binding domain-containing protein 12-like n=1 Tax=Colius striatus TaxID=57412 RepID=UPI002B1D2054|nr:EF-hand calcium-binding domain-containing protein 12-like [Colius striatus]
MSNLEELVTNVELSSRADGCRTVMFPTLKKLSVEDVITIWSSVSKHVQQQLLQRKPPAVTVTGLGTFHINKWLSFENGEVHTFQRPVFSLSKTVAQVRELQYASVPLPDAIKKVSVDYRKIHSDVPYSKEVVQNCMQETLKFFCFVLTNREDVDFMLKDFGTLAIRGTEVIMAFSEDFLLTLNKSTYVVEKLLAKQWVTSDEDLPYFPSRFGRVHQFPQFEIRAVSRIISLPHEELPRELKNALKNMGKRDCCQGVKAQLEGSTTKLLSRALSCLCLFMSNTGRQGRYVMKIEKRQSVFGINSRRKLEAAMVKMKEKEEEKKNSMVSLPELPQKQAAMESYERAELPQEKEERLSFSESTSSAQIDPQTVTSFIEGRKQFRAELEGLGDMERWLAHKPFHSLQERRYWKGLKAHRPEKKAAVIDRLDCTPPKSSQPPKKGALPLVCAPYAQALVTLQNLLHKKKLKLVDVFKKAGMEGRKIKRQDFIQVIKETKVPISDLDLEDVVIYLTSSKRGNFISLEDLVDCQQQWIEKKKGQSQESKTGAEAQLQKTTCKPATCSLSAEGTAKGMMPRAPTKPSKKLTHLEVPPVNTEPEQRHLSYEEMEEIGKIYRERRRWEKWFLWSSLGWMNSDRIHSYSLAHLLPHSHWQWLCDTITKEKNKDSPIERKEKCRMVRSGDDPIDQHCLPSTADADFGQRIDQYRRRAVVSYLRSSKLCRENDVPITDRKLQRALLHPGDKIIKEGEDIRKIRQPGGYYSTGHDDALFSERTSRSDNKEEKEDENRHLESNTMKATNDNRFWPGHLLDKLCLYFPDKQHDRAHALFSYVPPTKHSYYGF